MIASQMHGIWIIAYDGVGLAWRFALLAIQQRKSPIERGHSLPAVRSMINPRFNINCLGSLLQQRASRFISAAVVNTTLSGYWRATASYA